MRSIESINSAFRKWGFAHLKRCEYSREEVEEACRNSGWKLTNESNYHFTVEPGTAHTVSETDWEELRKRELERKQKLAQRRKQKTQTNT